jgi:hypothetical protein
MAESQSSRALDALLNRGGPAAEAIKTSSIHRTMLWRYRTGRGKPDAKSIALLEQLSGGEVPGNGWIDIPVERPRRRAGARP